MRGRFRWAWRSSCDVLAAACTRIRMRAALRWRNSFHAPRVPGHISPENHSGPGSVSTAPNGFGKLDGSGPAELNHRELRNRELPRFRPNPAPDFRSFLFVSRDVACHRPDFTVSSIGYYPGNCARFLSSNASLASVG